MACPELTEQIRREIAASLHQRKGDFACYFFTDLVTFTLPAGEKPRFVVLLATWYWTLIIAPPADCSGDCCLFFFSCIKAMPAVGQLPVLGY